jgi:membrane protease YdiL (CAAX protease family)
MKMRKQAKLNVWWFFAAVYALAAILYLPILLSGKGTSTLPNQVLMVMITFLPSSLGILFIALTRGTEARRDFWRRVVRWPRAHTGIAILGIFLLPFNVFITFLLAAWSGNHPIDLTYAATLFTDWKALLGFLFVELTFGALSEELGWRGYALDELQSRWGALTSSLVLGLIWAFWHTPAFLIPGLAQYSAGGLLSWEYPSFLVSVILGSVIHTWIYNNTGRSILAAGILMHFSQNAAMVFLGGIFDGFSLPVNFWLLLPVVTALSVFLLVKFYGARMLVRRSGQWKPAVNQDVPARY